MSGLSALPGRIWRAVALRLRHRRALAEARAATRRRLAAGPIQRVLLVCYGNICRSAFAHVLLVQQHADSGLALRSGGFHVKTGRETPALHQRLIRDAFGVDMSAHRSSLITADDLEWADTIVLMDAGNWEHLRRAGAAPEKLLWLGCLDQEGVEIEDPYSLPEPHARRVFTRLRDNARRLVNAAKSNG